MEQPAVTYDVAVLDADLQTVAKGTLGVTCDPNDGKTATGVLSLSGRYGINNLELGGEYSVATLQVGNNMAMCLTVMLTGTSGGDTAQIIFMAPGDSGLSGSIFVATADAPDDVQRHFILA
jgi:hypothetical protein